MAIMTVNYLSGALTRTVPVNVILPVDKLVMGSKGYANVPKGGFKTLYLLHGYLGNYTDWLAWTRVEIWAKEHDLAVVMPSGDNAFYIDHPENNNFYGQFIGEELVEMTRRMFPLSRKREDTFIAGLSMGGYGALRNGLYYNNTFSHIGAFSSAISVGQVDEQDKTNNLEALVKKVVKKKNQPKIYQAIGVSDFLYEKNVAFRDFLEEQGMDVTYFVGPGAHEGFFWDLQIGKFINWLPLEKGEQGRNSGNVKL